MMVRLFKISRLFLFTCAFALSGLTAWAEEGTHSALATPKPKPATGEVLLVVSGDVSGGDAEGKIEFDLESLRALGLSTIETSTVWTDGVQSFEGIRLSDFVAAIGASGKSALLASALNEYEVEIPISDATPDGPILALKMGGVDLSPRDKGPIWVVYPYDAGPEYQTDVIYSRSIWQVDAIEVLP